jgi:uncharacterized protein YggU (UPF0235/DUF167 family)
MKFLEKHSDNTYFIKLNVKTNAKNQKLVKNSSSFTLFLKSKPIQNKANKELINFIKNKLNIAANQIQITSGLKSQDKTIKISLLENIEEQKIMRKLIS